MITFRHAHRNVTLRHFLSHMYMLALVCTAVALYFGGKTLQPQVVWHQANSPFRRTTRGPWMCHATSITGQLRCEVAWSAYTYEYSATTGCISSLNNPVLFQEALQACDDSMAILVGSATSVGTVARLASIVNDPNVENAYERLPGYCCMDTALDSEYFGFNVSLLFLCLFALSFFSLLIFYIPCSTT
mgnify:CR=1 FL=1